MVRIGHMMLRDASYAICNYYLLLLLFYETIVNRVPPLLETNKAAQNV